MRNAFADELTKIGKENEKVVMLSADIGNRLFDNYKEKNPERFYNCGVAEQNTIGLAAGLAMSGFRPIAYTITPFITTRVYQQIRIDLCYNNVPVIVVGVGSGLSYSELGPTHHSTEDITIMRTLPNMTVLCPADANEARGALRAALKHDGPVYFRLGKKNEPLFHKDVPKFEIGKPIVMTQGEDVCILSVGNILPEAMDASKLLKEKGVSAQVVSFHTVKPLNKDFLKKTFSKFKIVATLEEHNLKGGFGSAVAEWLIDEEKDYNSKLVRFGVKDMFFTIIGKQPFARKYFNIDSVSIAKRIIKVLK
ncbi:transketolase [Candidatus Woesearchaeota archaeon]|nr:transketolase [Candidatus Woesearchaeota archaeon]